MPTYRYQAFGEESCRYCVNGFERRQSVHAERLSQCPECGSSVRRVISAPNLPSTGPSLSASNIERHGYTQYRKIGKGVYEKTAGQGPRHIVDQDD